MGLMSSGETWDGTPQSWEELACAIACVDIDLLEDIAQRATDEDTLLRMVMLSSFMKDGYDDGMADSGDTIYHMIKERTDLPPAVVKLIEEEA